MNLLAFRTLFRTQTGRFDLVNSDGSDNGADFYINAGQKYLDRIADIPQAIGRRFIDVSAGDWLVKFTNSRSILEVWCVGADDDGSTTRLPLTKVKNEVLRGVDRKTLETAYVELASSLDQDRPVYYAPAQLRLVTDDGTTGGLGGMMDVMSDGYQTYNGIVLMPPSDGAYSIEIVGNFYSDVLSSDTDHSFWSDVHPNILIMATMRQLEIMHRNREGRRDWEEAIMSEVVGIDMDGVAEDLAGDPSIMEG